MRKLLACLLFLASAATIFLSMAACFADVDASIYDYRNEVYNEQCYWGNCKNEASEEIELLSVCAHRRHMNLEIENSLNCIIRSKTETNYDYTTHRVEDEYYVVSPHSNGGFEIREEADYYEYKTEEAVGDQYVTVMQGSFCEEHESEAEDIMRDELKTAMRRNFICFLGYTASPYNLCIMLFLAALLIRPIGMPAMSKKSICVVSCLIFVFCGVSELGRLVDPDVGIYFGCFGSMAAVFCSFILGLYCKTREQSKCNAD